MRLLLPLLFCALPLSALANERCGPRDSFTAALSARFSEQQIAVGLTSSGTVVEIWASDSGGWTILETNPQGTSCIRAAGEGFSLAMSLFGDLG